MTSASPTRKLVIPSKVINLRLCDKWSLYQAGESTNEDIHDEFIQLMKIILLQLKSDSFPRFVHSQALRNAAPNLSKNPECMVLRVQKNSPPRKGFSDGWILSFAGCVWLGIVLFKTRYQLLYFGIEVFPDNII
jgi:hypothetical protein